MGMTFLRHPATQQERQNLNNDGGARECGFAVKMRRRVDLPTLWDDIRRGRDRSWKKHRKTRYHIH